VNQTHVSGDDKWISLLLRLSVGTLFGTIGINQMQGGGDSLSFYGDAFQGSYLPASLVQGFLGALPYVELFLAAWLLTGILQKWAWISGGFLLIALSLGLLVLGEEQAAANNSLYFLLIVAGLYFRRP